MSGSDAAGPRERTRPAAARFASLEPDAPISAIAVLPLAHFAEGDDLFARQLHDESDSVRISIQLLHAPSDTHLESRTSPTGLIQCWD